MKEQIKQELLEAQNHDEIFTWVYIKHCNYLIERIEELEVALSDIIECSDIESAVKEIALNALGKEN